MQIGTLSGNPVAAAAGLATLAVLRRPGAYEKVFATGRALMDGMRRILRDAGLPAQILGEPPLFDVVFADTAAARLSRRAARRRRSRAAGEPRVARGGVLKGESKYYISLAHDEADIAHTLAAFAHAIATERGTMSRFAGRVALITAAASGIGRATAEIISAEGGQVVAIDTNPDRLGDLLGAIEQAGGRAAGRVADALDPAQVAEAVAWTAATFGTIDILVNAVGGSTVIARPAATMEQLSLADWQKLIAFNLDGTFLFCHEVIPVMKRQRHGKIVNLASIAGRGLSVSSSAAYAAAKGGIIALTKKLVGELGPYGINVNAIAPSLTLTERIRPHWNQRAPEDRAAEIARTPLRRVAEAGDQARVIAFLASADADFVTGRDDRRDGRGISAPYSGSASNVSNRVLSHTTIRSTNSGASPGATPGATRSRYRPAANTSIRPSRIVRTTRNDVSAVTTPSISPRSSGRPRMWR